MFKLVLYQPEIPPNTGNLIRLCANTGCELHLVQPLGFRLDHRRLRRAGLDYHEYAAIQVHRSWQDWLVNQGDSRVVAFTGRGETRYDQFAFQAGDALLFGSETRGLPEPILTSVPEGRRLRLPMRPGSRSLNLANAASVAVYEAWRQSGFGGAG